MAIAADSETTFLQELGRKRIAEGERLQLYIRTYTYNQIHTRYNLLYNDLMFMVKLGLKPDDQIFMGLRLLPEDYLCPMKYYTGKKKITKKLEKAYAKKFAALEAELRADYEAKLAEFEIDEEELEDEE